MGAIEKIPNPLCPDCFNKPSTIRNAGAPIMAMVVPSDAAKDMGINNREAGTSLSLDNLRMGGNMMAVMVT